MGYQSLYRRYRSQKFSEIRGQEQVTHALRTAVAEGRHSHAYLFSGPRGTGKTSTARVLAKALNCENLADGEPCGECASCQTIEKGSSFDLHELDAASNNKTDDIRDLIAKVALGSPGRTKVYILDEVHMLTAGAENALLKTLEEPPPHVVFVLATTEPHKVVETIRSRTQHFEFKLIGGQELDEHVRWIIGDAGLDVDEAGIQYALRQGGGSARDTLSALELVASTGGVPEGSDIGHEVAMAIGAGDPAALMAIVQRSLERGREPRTIGELTLNSLRDAFLVSMGAPLPHLSEAAQTSAGELAGAVSPATITRSLESIGSALVEMRQAPDPRVPLEVTLLRLTRRDGHDTAALLQRIEALESQVDALTSSAAATPPETVAPKPPPVEDVVASLPPPAQAGGQGPAAMARTVLSDGPAGASSPPPPARNSPPPPPATQAPAAAQTPAAAQAPATAQATDAPVTAAPAESPPAPAASAAAPTGSPLSLDQLTAMFPVVLEQDVAQKVRARFRLGHFIGIDGDVATFALPNDHVLPRCEEVRAEVEQALAAKAGRPITVQLVVDGATPPPRAVGQPAAVQSEPPGSRPAEAEAATPGQAADDENINVDDLDDAPDVASTGIDRLTQAFPGAQVIEAQD